jgi:hypothetical protein
LVNASLNWASIVGIVLAVGGAFLYFMRNFKPALARDYDVFFAAIGLLCGGILFFQGWRLDPILQFGQFLLAGTTVFFAYESVRLRGVTTEQARRSSYFEDEEPAPFAPRGGLGGRSWEGESFDETDRYRQRIPTREPGSDDDFYRPRRTPSRAAIPERAMSRRPEQESWDPPGPVRAEGPRGERDAAPSRYSAGAASPAASNDFGARRRDRDGGEARRGSRPVASTESMPRSSRRPGAPEPSAPRSQPQAGATAGIPQGSPLRGGRGETPGPRAEVSEADFAPLGGSGSPGRPPAANSRPETATPPKAGGERPEAGRPYSRSERPGTGPGPGAGPRGRDNSSRFDD